MNGVNGAGKMEGPATDEDLDVTAEGVGNGYNADEDEVGQSATTAGGEESSNVSNHRKGSRRPHPDKMRGNGFRALCYSSSSASEGEEGRRDRGSQFQANPELLEHEDGEADEVKQPISVKPSRRRKPLGRRAQRRFDHAQALFCQGSSGSSGRTDGEAEEQHFFQHLAAQPSSRPPWPPPRPAPAWPRWCR